MKRLLGAVAIAALLALTGCAGHGRGNSGLSSTDQSHVTSVRPAATSTTKAAPTPASTGATTSDASIDSQLAAIDKALNGINTSMSSIDSNITQADKAGDDDN